MPNKDKLNNIELRSEEVQDLLGHIPPKIIRIGIGVISLTLVVLLVGSWFYKYPDIIPSQIVITTENPPASIISRSSGKIQSLLVEDKQKIYAGQLLAIVENTANYTDLIKLKQELITFKPCLIYPDSSVNCQLSNTLVLGELQNSYNNFIKSHTDYLNFKSLDYHNKKISALQNQLSEYRAYYSNLLNQKKLLAKELSIIVKQFERDSLLYNKSVISETDLERSKSMLLQKKYAFEGAKTSLTNTNIQISQIEQSIVELELDFIEQKKQLEMKIKDSYDILVSQIAAWEKTYLLQSPIEGKITFTKFWSENQNINPGDVVFTVVPERSGKLLGKVLLPIQRSGKVKKGQKVNIKLDNYPYMEYGMVRGEINNISLIPQDDFYILEVDLPNKLVSSYKKKLNFSREMKGTAEIITEDRSLLEKIIQPLRLLLETQRDLANS